METIAVVFHFHQNGKTLGPWIYLASSLSLRALHDHFNSVRVNIIRGSPNAPDFLPRNYGGRQVRDPCNETGVSYAYLCFADCVRRNKRLSKGKKGLKKRTQDPFTRKDWYSVKVYPVHSNQMMSLLILCRLPPLSRFGTLAKHSSTGQLVLRTQTTRSREEYLRSHSPTCRRTKTMLSGRSNLEWMKFRARIALPIFMGSTSPLINFAPSSENGSL